MYSQTKLLELATVALDYFGTGVLNNGHFIERILRDAMQLHVLGEPVELLRLYIGSKGLQFSGVSAMTIFYFSIEPTHRFICRTFISMMSKQHAILYIIQITQ